MCTGSVEVTLKNPKTDLEQGGHKQKVRKNKKEKKS